VSEAAPIQFAVERARVALQTALPTLSLELAVRSPARALEGMALSCRIRIEPARRGYDASEQERLGELCGIGPGARAAAGALEWCEASLLVPPFVDATTVELALPCSFDLEVAAGRYLQALGDGEVPLRLLFRGVVFARGERGLTITPLPWDREAEWRMPVALWRAAIERHFPDAGWLRLSRATIDALQRERSRRALPSWERLIQALLVEAGR
jgi:hypothetical protein